MKRYFEVNGTGLLIELDLKPPLSADRAEELSIELKAELREVGREEYAAFKKLNGTFKLSDILKASTAI